MFSCVASYRVEWNTFVSKKQIMKFQIYSDDVSSECFLRRFHGAATWHSDKRRFTSHHALDQVKLSPLNQRSVSWFLKCDSGICMHDCTQTKTHIQKCGVGLQHFIFLFFPCSPHLMVTVEKQQSESRVYQLQQFLWFNLLQWTCNVVLSVFCLVLFYLCDGKQDCAWLVCHPWLRCNQTQT